MPSQEQWEAGLKKTYDQWKETKKPSFFEKYSTACATYLCSPDFKNTGKHWFCQSKETHNYAIASLLMFAYDSEEGEAKQRCDIYAQNFASMLRACTKCRISYQCSIEGLIEFLLTEVKIKPQSAKLLLKEFQRRDRVRLASELVEKPTSLSTLTEIMWSESCIIVPRFLTENHVIPGVLTDGSNSIVDELQLCPGFLALTFSHDMETHAIASKHICKHFSRDNANQTRLDDPQLFVFRRMLLIGLKRNVQARDKADIAWFRAAEVLSATQGYTKLTTILVELCLEELKLCNVDTGLGAHYLLLTLLQIFTTQQSAGTSDGITKDVINDFVHTVVSKSRENMSLKPVDPGDSSPLSENRYENLNPHIILQWFEIWFRSDPIPDTLTVPIRCLMNCIFSQSCGDEISRDLKVRTVKFVFDIIAKFPKEIYKNIVQEYRQPFLIFFDELNNNSIVSLWHYQCYSDLQSHDDVSSWRFWKEALTSSQFVRYCSKNENVSIISDILKESVNLVIPPLKNPERDDNILSGEGILKGMLESVLDIAAPSTLVKVLQDKFALKTIVLMWTRQDAYVSLIAEEFIKQTLEDYSAESTIGALVHHDPLILIQVLSMIQSEAAQAQIAWLKLIPGICKLSLLTLDEIYAPRDGIDTSDRLILESLHSLWQNSWVMCDTVLKNIRKWCTEFDVIQLLSATLEYCKGILSKFRLLESEFTTGLSCNDEEGWGSILILPAITCVNDMGDLLKLNLPNLLAMALAVIVEILDYMRYFKVPVPNTLKVLFEDLSTGKKTSRLDESQIRELLTTCGVSDADIAYMLELKRTGKGRKDAKLALENSQVKSTSSQTSQDMKTENLRNFQQHSSSVSTKAQSSIGDFFKLSNGFKPPLPPQRTVVNNTIVPKTQHSTGISMVRAQLEQSKANQAPKLPPVSKFGVIHPERPPGFNIPKKSATTDKTNSVSSEDDDEEDDDDNDEGGALSALGARPKNVDEATAKLREAYSKKGKHRTAPGLIADAQIKSRQLAKSSQEMEEQMMKKRLMASPESMYKVLLGWDYFASSPSSLKEKFTIPDKFDSVDHYKSVMTPLLYLEAWELIRNTKSNNTRDSKLFNFSLVFGKRVKVDDYVDVYVSTSKKALAESGLQDSDLLVIAYDSKRTGEVVQPSASIPHCFAKVKEGTLKYSKEYVDFQIRMLDNHSFLGPMVTGSIVSCFSVGSVTTLEREYTSLVALPYYNLLNEVIAAKPAISNDNKQEIRRIQQEQNLNESQATAVSRSIHNKGFSLIQGPPGTGKTKTIISIIGAYFMNNSMVSQASGSDIALGKKILVCAPSNAAVDEIVVRLRDGITDSSGNKRKLNIIRLGRIDKVSEQVRDLTLDSLVVKELSASAEPADDLLRRDHTALVIKRNTIREKLSVSEDSDALSVEDVKKLEAELKAVGVQIREKGYALDMQRERLDKARKQRDAQYRKQQHDILNNAQVVCTTLSASSHPLLVSMAMAFESVIVDEAAQSIELSSLIPMRYGCKKCVMVGDPNQLPPTVLSQEATRLKYNQSLFVRMFNQWKDVPGAVCMLDTQFRMHPEISQFPSKEFYKNMLKDAPGLSEKLIRPWHHEYPALGPYSFFDIEGKHERGNSMSFLNYNEAKFALQLVQFLISKYPDCGSIGVIAPYKEQVNHMRRIFLENMGSEILSLVDFNSIDGFQGQEKDIIIMSCVRASDSHSNSIGFLSDVRRLNVAITRAKTSLWILGRSSSLVVNSVWRSLIEDARDRQRLIQSIPGNFKRSINEFKPARLSQITHDVPVKRPAESAELPTAKRQGSNSAMQNNGSDNVVASQNGSKPSNVLHSSNSRSSPVTEQSKTNTSHGIESGPVKTQVDPSRNKPATRIPGHGKKPPSLFITKRRRPGKRPGGA